MNGLELDNKSMNISNTPKKIVTRFAPSPTGFMHIGGVRTALFAFLYARKHEGTFILRIEDTDKSREVAGSKEHIQEALSWLGISYDFGPEHPGPFGSCIQSERLPIYKKYAQQLVDAGYAYPDPYTEEEVAAFRAQAEAEKRPFLFRHHRPEHSAVWDGTTTLRFRVPELKRVEWVDEVRGPLSAGEESLDDFIILKQDGYPTYPFAHIVDDYEMGVTHIMRGDEFIASTPRFLSLYDALGFPYPAFVSLPPILRSDRSKKLGKRDGAKDILDYKKEGYLPEALINYLALIGWNPGTEQELFSMQELIEQFSLPRVQKGGGAFNDEKLDWFNVEHIKQFSSEVFWERAKSFIPEIYRTGEKNTQLHAIEKIIRERIVVFSDIEKVCAEYNFFFEDPIVEKTMIPWKTLQQETDGYATTLTYLAHTATLLASLSEQEWSYATISATLMPYATEIGKGAVLWPLRVVLSGKEKSPDPFEIASIIGKEKTLTRINSIVSQG